MRPPPWKADSIPDLAGKRAIVTGANSGIGLVTARELARHGAHVTLAVRRPERGEAAADAIRGLAPQARLDVAELDVSSQASIRDFAKKWLRTNDRLDILVNNAGIMGIPKRQVSVDGYELQFATNHLGPFALTRELMPVIVRTPAARVVAVASNAHSPARFDFDDPMAEKSYSPFRAYARSKLANLLFVGELQRRFERSGVDAIAVAGHPGWTNTNIATGPLQGRPRVAHALGRVTSAVSALPADKGALPILFAATAPDVAGDGYYGPRGPGELRGYPGPAKRSPRSLDVADGERLWRLSADFTGGSYLDTSHR